MNADGTGQANITNNSSVDLSPDWGVVPTVSQANPPNEAKDTGTVKNKDKTKGRAQRGGR